MIVLFFVFLNLDILILVDLKHHDTTVATLVHMHHRHHHRVEVAMVHRRRHQGLDN